MLRDQRAPRDSGGKSRGSEQRTYPKLCETCMRLSTNSAISLISWRLRSA
jgi:hypothetical protein